MSPRAETVPTPLFLLGGYASPVAPEPSFTGEWHGTIEVPGQPLAFGIYSDGTSGAITIPAQMITGVSLGEVSQTGADIRFTLPGVPGEPTYTGIINGDSISGTLTQSGQSVPFTLTRGPLAAPARPQEPLPPFPYRTEDITVASGEVTLAGTVTAPEGTGPFPGLVMITGSGAHDRDETIATHKPFLLLADTLTTAGFVVLRTDDRGVGGSGGTLDGTSYEVLADDARAGAALLRERPDVDAARVGLFGHSEGGYLAPLAAQRSAPGDIAFTVLMAAPSVSGGDVLIEQNQQVLTAAGLPTDQLTARVASVRTLVEHVRAGDLDAARQAARDLATAQGSPPDTAAAQVESLIPFLTYDPQPALRALRIPTYAVFGSKDLQVPSVQNEQPMQEALADAPGSEVRTFAGLNHLMQPAVTGSPVEYATIETTIDPAVLDALTQWLAASA